MSQALSARLARYPRVPVVSAVFGCIFVGVVVAGALAIPARQTLSEVPEGIQTELLAAAPELPFGPGESAAFLLRYRYAPGAQLEVPYVGSVLIAVESGTLSLDGVGNEVSVLYPADVTEQPLTGMRISKRQVGEALPVGSSAEIGTGGTVYALTGEVGSTRNAGEEPLVLLVVLFVSEIRSGDVTSVVVEGTPPP